MSTRKKIKYTDTMQDLLVVMSEGNPGGLDVLMQLMKENQMDAIGHILSLDDMNIRGCQIWIAYKDFCGCDLEKFIGHIKSRDQAMVDAVNNECELGGFNERAVTHRASFSRNVGLDGRS